MVSLERSISLPMDRTGPRCPLPTHTFFRPRCRPKDCLSYRRIHTKIIWPASLTLMLSIAPYPIMPDSLHWRQANLQPPSDVLCPTLVIIIHYLTSIAAMRSASGLGSIYKETCLLALAVRAVHPLSTPTYPEQRLH